MNTRTCRDCGRAFRHASPTKPPSRCHPCHERARHEQILVANRAYGRRARARKRAERLGLEPRAAAALLLATIGRSNPAPEDAVRLHARRIRSARRAIQAAIARGEIDAAAWWEVEARDADRVLRA